MAQTTSRVLALLNLLQTHRQWSGPELAERLGVTERTMRRDIERLRELGYEVAATRGSAGGYRLEAGSSLPPLLLTNDEAVTMAIGLRLAASEGIDDGEQTTLSALIKLEQVLPSALRTRVSALGEHVRRDAPGRGPDDEPLSPELLAQLALACRDSERIRFHYTTAAGVESDRLVEPHSLVVVSRRWFLLCWDTTRDAWRTFRLDRMSRFFATHVRVEPRELPAEDAAAFVRESSPVMWGRVTAEVVLDIPVDEARALLGRWGADAVAIDERSTSWPIRADSAPGLLSALVWIPATVPFEVRANDETLAGLRAATDRLRSVLSGS